MVKKSSDIIRLLLGIAVAVLAGVILSFGYFKLDLTEEKRHSLTDETKEVLETLDDNIFFKVYLTGDIPAEYKSLEKAIQEKLDEFRDYSGDMIDYEFVDPYVSEDQNENKQFWEKLYDNGIKYSNVSDSRNKVKAELVLFPGATMNFRGKDYPINFLKSGAKKEKNYDMVNSSITNLEYELVSNIIQYTRFERPKIGVLEGHGELSDMELASINTSLYEFYDTERVMLNEGINTLTEKYSQKKSRNIKYDAIIVPKPTKPFTFKDQFILDQYVMNGGKVLWLMDKMHADLDSLVSSEQVMSLPIDLGLSNMLFDYGARINNDLIIDFNCAPIEVDAGPMGDKRKKMLVPWFYSPRLFMDSVLMPYHPIINNLNNVITDFASSIDTIENDISKRILLTSSNSSRRLKSPVRINLNIAQLGFEYFEDQSLLDPYSPIAVLLEGEFTSAFKNRGVNDTIKTSKDIAFMEKGKNTSMIVVSDGDIIRNDVSYSEENGVQPYPLGFDPVQRSVIYDNTEFIMNCMNYLLNDQSVIALRTREFKSRYLNGAAVQKNATMIKFINFGLPLLVIVIMGFGLSIYRRKKYSA